MPELPEVETIRISLSSCLPGRQIQAVEVWREGVLLSRPERLEGLTILDLERRGKYLQINLSDRSRLLVHLRMTGRLFYCDACPEPEKHTHVQMRLLPEGCLTYVDSRRFGRLQQFGPNEPLTGSAFGGMEKLGPEPLGVSLTTDHLLKESGRHARMPIKSLLLNQEAIAGLGNIYADETLHLAGIHPQKPAGTLSAQQAEELCDAIRNVIGKAIDSRGTTLRDYVDGHRIPGTFQYELQVYGRKGQLCRRCGGQIIACVLSGRTTCFCPDCQIL